MEERACADRRQRFVAMPRLGRVDDLDARAIHPGTRLSRPRFRFGDELDLEFGGQLVERLRGPSLLPEGRCHFPSDPMRWDYSLDVTRCSPLYTHAGKRVGLFSCHRSAGGLQRRRTAL